jgi:hypothetical protein
MNTSTDLLETNIHVRLPAKFNHQLREIARQNNLKPSTFTRLLLMRHLQEYNLRNRFL